MLYENFYNNDSYYMLCSKHEFIIIFVMFFCYVIIHVMLYHYYSFDTPFKKKTFCIVELARSIQSFFFFTTEKEKQSSIIGVLERRREHT